jgi:hypothetical protein
MINRIFITQRVFLVFLGAVLCFTVFPGKSMAQFDIGSLLQGGASSPAALQIRSSPTLPGPREEVALTAELYSFDLNRATVTWMENGVRKAQGIGLKRFSFRTGTLGSETVIDVTAESDDGLVSKRLVFRPGAVDLVWESDGYVHPLYRGKALPAPQSSILVVALPHLRSSTGGKEIEGASVIYEWTVDGTVIGNSSGTGKNTLTVTAPTAGSLAVGVTASSLDGTLKARTEKIISVASPRIVFYEEDPILGLRTDKALADAFTLTKRETRLVASPFYFSTAKREGGDITYGWSVNGTTLEGGEEKSAIDLTGGGEGLLVSIKLTIDNAKRFLQTSDRTVKGATGEEGSANTFFGF